MSARGWLLHLRYAVGRWLVSPVIRLPRLPSPIAARRAGGAK